MARLAALLALAVAAHAAAGAVPAGPEVLLLTVAAVASVSGRDTAAGYGFAAGLAADLFLATPAGLCASVYTLVGWVAATPLEAVTSAPTRGCRAVRASARAVATGLAGGMLAAGTAAALAAAPWSAAPAPASLAVGSAAAVAAPPVFAAVRWLLGGGRLGEAVTGVPLGGPTALRNAAAAGSGRSVSTD